MRSKSLHFTGPKRIAVHEDSLPAPSSEQVLVETIYSAISPGTELLVYRGQFPRELPVDENISALTGEFCYPLQYGYASVGKVIASGSQVTDDWSNKLVFAFQPHASHYCAHPDELLPIPDDLTARDAIFFPMMETAVNFIQDGGPQIGERVLVCGQGIIGLLSTALLARFPLECLVSLDNYALRRQTSTALGAHASLHPSAPDARGQLDILMPGGADLSFELSGAPEALDQVIALTGFAGRVIIGSWYGSKDVRLNLGGRFHRDRIQLISSQVSTLSPELRGRWTKGRRFAVVWEMLGEIRPSAFITHYFPIDDAQQAYQMLDRDPGETIQAIFTYGEETS